MAERVEAYIALGSNLGNRREVIRCAIDGLASLPGTSLIGASSLIETAAVGPGEQPSYLNAAAGVRTSLSARDLLGSLLALERRLGRVRAREPERWLPRVIDLDLLLYGREVIDEPGLTVPHDRMHERRFVLAPLSEIAPDARHPLLEKTMRELLTCCG